MPPAGRRNPAVSKEEEAQQKSYENADVEQMAKRLREIDAGTGRLFGSKQRLPWYSIDPRKSSRIGYWDCTTSVALIFVAIFTPFEVGFVTPPDHKWSDPLFLINRIVDVIFIVDFVLQFFILVPIFDTKTSMEIWITSPKDLGLRYLCSPWAVVDIVSIGISSIDVVAPAGSTLSKFKALRAIRVLRLVKLIKILAATKIFKRWELRLSINYALLSICKILLGLVFLCHLFACLWGMQASFDPLGSWPGVKEYCVAHDEAGGAPCPDRMLCSAGIACMPPSTMYLYSIYWTIATVTSVGYGDVSATAFNNSEQIVNTAIMLTGALCFAYLVGSFCGLTSAMTPETTSFRNDMTDLNNLMSRGKTPSELRVRLREYMHASKVLRGEKTRQHLYRQLSPGMAGEFALQIGQRWLFVPENALFRALRLFEAEDEHELFADVALLLRAHVFPPGEYCPTGILYICTHGHALYAGRVKKPEQVWGKDECYSAESLRLQLHAIAVGYLQVLCIDGEKMRAAFSKYPKAKSLVDHFESRFIARRGLVRAAEEKSIKDHGAFRGRRHPLLARPAAPTDESPSAEAGAAGARGTPNVSKPTTKLPAPAPLAPPSHFAYSAAAPAASSESPVTDAKATTPSRVEDAASRLDAEQLTERTVSFFGLEMPSGKRSPTPQSHRAADGGEGQGAQTALLRDMQLRQAGMEAELRRLSSGLDEVLMLLRAGRSGGPSDASMSPGASGSDSFKSRSAAHQGHPSCSA